MELAVKAVAWVHFWRCSYR